MKKVTFHPDTKTPPKTKKCYSCGFRNISPYIKEMFECFVCQRTLCIDCIAKCIPTMCYNCYLEDEIDYEDSYFY